MARRRNALLFAQLCLDGYDVAALSFVAPVIAVAWRLHDPRALGVVFSAGIAGMFLGSVLGGFAADRIGAGRTLVGGTALVGVATIACALAASLPQLLLFRAVCGLGLGTAMPCIVRLVLAGSGRGRAGPLVRINLGTNVGAALPGLVAAAALPAIGWRGVFWIGGLLPLLLSVALGRWLPDAAAAPAAAARPRVGAIFEGALALATPLLWLVAALNGAMLYLVVSWIPTLARDAGLGLAAASVAAVALQLGGLGAGLVIGPALDRFGAVFLAAMLILSALLSFALTATIGHAVALAATLFLLGGTMFATLFSLNFLSGRLYDPAVRGAGAGLAGAAGRIGAILGPIAGAVVVAGHGPAGLIATVSLPAAVAAVAAVIVARAVRRGPSPPAEAVFPSATRRAADDGRLAPHP